MAHHAAQRSWVSIVSALLTSNLPGDSGHASPNSVVSIKVASGSLSPAVIICLICHGECRRRKAARHPSWIPWPRSARLACVQGRLSSSWALSLLVTVAAACGGGGTSGTGGQGG